MVESGMAFDETTNLAELRGRVQKFVDERDWGKYHNPKDVAISIAIEAAELMEHFQWARESEVEEIMEDQGKAAEIADELADVMIYCLSFANALGIDVARAVIEKIEKNKIKYPAGQVKGTYKKYTDL